MNNVKYFVASVCWKSTDEPDCMTDDRLQDVFEEAFHVRSDLGDSAHSTRSEDVSGADQKALRVESELDNRVDEVIGAVMAIDGLTDIIPETESDDDSDGDD